MEQKENNFSVTPAVDSAAVSVGAVKFHDFPMVIFSPDVYFSVPSVKNIVCSFEFFCPTLSVENVKKRNLNDQHQYTQEG